jgi:hypothetical protein
MDADHRLPTPPLRARVIASRFARRRLGDWRKRKRKRKRYGQDYDVLIFHVIYFPFIVLAFFEFPSLRTHFWPFT